MACIPQVAIQRPDIEHVGDDLTEWLALEMSLQNAESNSGTSGSALSTTCFPLESKSEVISSTRRYRNILIPNSNGHVFNPSEVHSITNRFETEIEGGFGKVYLGELDGRNLVSLVGCCDDDDMKALVYDYMAEGNLQQKLSGMQVKIGDFGLSRAFHDDTSTAYSTCPGVGAFGYRDLEIQDCRNLNKRSNVYSFGVILLQLISGRPAVMKAPDGKPKHISEWVDPKMKSEDIRSIMDPRLEGQFNAASVEKFSDIAISCTQRAAIQRPDIKDVEAVLREYLKLEISGSAIESKSAPF
ncbi:probable LRR receptor-like serine/threonine-protein kinase At4g29180 [Neltuma alba]|uniref:probable LRR receptor-like serine/threonine-protein kinase At4g29180 n=1 Tax=Neltuma alba TaxID=207710 RepID=UPI0010A50B84|nr:probable LRR receptor-like serine/threonine-protein kinase At4g29180 [Prosopis alba]